MIQLMPHHYLRAPASRVPPICPYCLKRSTLVTSRAVYGGRDYGPVWCCAECEAWVGVHRDSKDFAPLGRLANASLRKLKMKAHALLDPCWRNRPGHDKGRLRKAIYKLLADELGIDGKACHVGEFDDDLCERAIRILSSPRWGVLQATLATTTNEA